MINIVTSVCIDVDDFGKEVVYPHLENSIDALERREIYWRCAATFCMTSVRVNKDNKHIVFTNDSDDIIVDGQNIKNLLIGLGVEIIVHPFEKFDPKYFSKRFRNAFYKLEVISLLGTLQHPSILLDADCLWTKRDEKLYEILNSGNYLLLQDTYQRSLTPDRKKHNLTMREMGDLYKTIPVAIFNRDCPVWYGGELIGGSPELFKIIAEKVLLTFDYCMNQYDLGNVIQFANGFSIFNGEEFITSYVYNSLQNVNIYDTYGQFTKRLWTNIEPNNVKKEDINLTIWHLPAEKDTGLKALFADLVKSSSPFWILKSGFAEYLGNFIGIPRRTNLF